MQSIDLLRKLAVLDRERIEQVLNTLLDCRVSDDFDRIANLLSPNVTLEVVGERRYVSYAGLYEGREAALGVLKRMHLDNECLNNELLEHLIDQDRALMRRRIHARHRGTGIALEHEIWDLLRFEDGLIVSMTKMFDIDANRRMQGLR